MSYKHKQLKFVYTGNNVQNMYGKIGKLYRDMYEMYSHLNLAVTVG